MSLSAHTPAQASIARLGNARSLCQHHQPLAASVAAIVNGADAFASRSGRPYARARSQAIAVKAATSSGAHADAHCIVMPAPPSVPTRAEAPGTPELITGRPSKTL